MHFFDDNSFPNTSKFDLISLEANSKVNNLVVIGFLVDLVFTNNHY